MMPRIVYLATADARGHLMRAQLLVHALRTAGAQVDVLTTSDEGQAFLAVFGIDAAVLSHHYAVQFDERQNMLRDATDRNVAHYVFKPTRMLRDIARLRAIVRDADLVINDSFHPALLFMGAVPGWRRRVVHVYGGSLRRALTANFDERLPRALARAFARIVDWQIDSALCCIEHDFAYDAYDTADDARRSHVHYRLPTPVPVVAERPAAAPAAAAVYLNPHFRDVALADALSAGMRDAGLAAHRVGEGYAGRDGWIGVDADWAARAAHAPLIVSAPGMAALSIARVYRRPILLVQTDQPEQASNAARAARLKLVHRVVTWRGDAAAFRHEVGQAAADLMRDPGTPAGTIAGREHARARVEAWTSRILALHARTQTADADARCKAPAPR
ncbi:glycosyltransferase family protein [Burkholderia stabilis]